MATTVHEPPKIEGQRDPSQSHGGFNSGGQDLVPGNLPAVKRYSPPPASTGIWVVLASITMTFAAFTSALIVRQGSALDWRHLTLPNILYVNTLVLFASSFALEMTRRRIRVVAGGLKAEGDPSAASGGPGGDTATGNLARDADDQIRAADRDDRL